MIAQQLSAQEKRKLFRIKLLFFGVSIIFVIQFILPLERTKEAWPLMRWDMFSYEVNPPAERGSLTTYDIVAYDSDRQAHYLPLANLYASTHITSSPATAESILAFAVQDVDLTIQSQTRHAILQRLSYLTQTTIVQVEIRLREHDYELSQQQYPDMETPSRTEVILRLTDAETIIVDNTLD
jgi:hypothetical protein